MWDLFRWLPVTQAAHRAFGFCPHVSCQFYADKKVDNQIDHIDHTVHHDQ